MAVDGYGTKNQPQFDGTKASNLAADENAIANYAALVGNRKVGPGSQRRALTGNDVWDGLEWYETDTGDCFVYNAYTSSWSPQLLVPPTSSGGFFTFSSGWAASSGGNSGVNYITLAGAVIVQIYVSFFRTGGAITVPSNGNISNVTVGTVSVKPQSIIALPSGSAGRLAHWTIDSDGSVQLVAVAPGTNIATGDGFSLSGLYLTSN